MTARWNFDLYIDGKWDKGEAGGKPIEVINPATEEVDRHRARGVAEGRGARHRGRPPGVRRRPVAVDEAGRAGRLRAQDGRGARVPRRRAPRADRRRDRLGRVHHRLRAGRRVDRACSSRTRRWPRPLRLGRDRSADRRSDGHGRQRHRPRAGRRRRRDHAVQLPVHAQRGQVGTRARRRLHRGAQAPPVDAARRVHDRRGRRGGRHPAGSVQRDHRPRRGRRGADHQPAGRHDHDDRIHRDRAAASWPPAPRP